MAEVRLLLPCLFALACAASPEVSGPAEAVDTGLSEELVEPLPPLVALERVCVTAEPVDTSAWYGLYPLSRQRSLVLTLDDLARSVVVVTFPADGSSAYEEGAPVLVMVGPPSSALLVDMPSSRLEDGVIEIQPVYPGTAAGAVVAPGTPDFGGADSAETVAQALRFASGELTAEDGYRLEEIVAQPVCRPSVMVAASSGGLAASAALGDFDPSALDDLLGVSFFEVPALPIMATEDLGTVAFDSDLTVDADQDGTPWDDGRNRSVLGCALSGCELDLAGLSLGPAPVEGAPPGVYLDRNGNGVPDIDYDSQPPWPDLDEDGQVSALEDFPLGPHPMGIEGTLTWVYTPEVLAALAERDDPELEAWFGEGSTWAAEVQAGWVQRDVAHQLGRWQTELPDSVQVGVVWSEVPHGVSLPERPQLELVRAAAREAELRVWLAPSVEAVSCVAGPELAGHAGSASGTGVVEGEVLLDHALSEELDLQQLRMASAMEHWVQHWGLPDACASGFSG